MPTYLNLTDVAAERLTAHLVRSGLALGNSRKVRRLVLDTFDGRLHAAGLRLELREGDRRELVLVTASDSPAAYLAWDAPAPGVVADLPSGPFGVRVAHVIRERRLLPVLEVVSTCHDATRCDRRGKPVVTVSMHDDVVVCSPSVENVPVRVVEISSSAGHEGAEARVVATLAELGPPPRSGDLVDAVVAATHISLRGHDTSPKVPMDHGDDALDAFRAVLRRLLVSIDDNVPGTLAQLDTEFLHDLRVALRRTRSVLAEGKTVLPEDVRARFRAGFTELATATGLARDLDVYVLGWSDMVAPLVLDDPSTTAPILDELESRRRDAHGELAHVLTHPETRELLDSWRAWLDDDTIGDGEAGPIGPFIAKRIAKAQKGLLRDGRAITSESAPKRLHDLRKDAKKLRYLLECFASVLPAKARKSFVTQLKALQDNLGQHQDAEVQAAELRSLAHDLHERCEVDADTLLVIGRLVDLLERTRQRERVVFGERFAAYDTAANRALLDMMLARASEA